MKIPVKFEHEGKDYTGYVTPLGDITPPLSFMVVLNDMWRGTLYASDGVWRFDNFYGLEGVASILGEYVILYYE